MVAYRDLRSPVLAILVYGFLVLAFTVVSLYSSPVESQLGRLRTVSTIPDHLLILAAGGAALGLLSTLVFRRLDITLIILIPTFVLLLDLDHLPIVLGISQPIRPAHSLIFIATAFLLITTIIKRPSLSFAAMSGFFAHLGIDAGIFPPFSPIDFAYYAITDYRWVFLALALASALGGGYYSKKESMRAK